MPNFHAYKKPLFPLQSGTFDIEKTLRREKMINRFSKMLFYDWIRNRGFK